MYPNLIPYYRACWRNAVGPRPDDEDYDEDYDEDDYAADEWDDEDE